MDDVHASHLHRSFQRQELCEGVAYGGVSARDLAWLRNQRTSGS
jgi:hypothetical protein